MRADLQDPGGSTQALPQAGKLRAPFEQRIHLFGSPHALHDMEASDPCPPPSSRCLQKDAIQNTLGQLEARLSLEDFKISSPSLPWNSRAHVLSIHYLFCRHNLLFTRCL